MEELAQVYGRSLFEVARSRTSSRCCVSSSGSLPTLCRRTATSGSSSSRPISPPRRSRTALEKVLTDADQRLLSFLDLLIENHRMPVIFRIRREYERLWELENRLLPVVLTSAVELDEQTVKAWASASGSALVAR